MLIDALEWAGSLLGLLGAFLLATHTRISRYGWLAFLAANLAMIGFALGIGRYGLLLQQTGFMFTSLLGIYRAGFFRIMPLWKCDWITAATRVSVVVMVLLLLFVGFFAINTEYLACGHRFVGGFPEGPMWTFRIEPIHCGDGT